jgi:hypothetical protein
VNDFKVFPPGSRSDLGMNSTHVLFIGAAYAHKPSGRSGTGTTETKRQIERVLMIRALKNFFGRLGGAARQAPSYPSDTQKKRQEKEQMSQPQEEFIDSKSVPTKNTGTTERKER